MGSLLKLGPLVKNLGKSWDEAGKSELLQILISHDDQQIYSLKFVYAENGVVSESDVYGQPDGSKFDVVDFNYPSEFLTGVSGTYSLIMDDEDFSPAMILMDELEFMSKGLSSVTFFTNRGQYGPFGSVKCASDVFNYQIGPRCSFGGFHGTVCSSLLSIGIYMKSKIELSNSACKDKNGNGSG